MASDRPFLPFFLPFPVVGNGDEGCEPPHPHLFFPSRAREGGGHRNALLWRCQDSVKSVKRISWTMPCSLILKMLMHFLCLSLVLYVMLYFVRSLLIIESVFAVDQVGYPPIRLCLTCLSLCFMYWS
ncbi:hypothetical protein HanIR_Chr11g0516431 [Helianthus annuus]|nr:hypothetical protein HanIR_Chr11g0516431 [Helianthus annuus]